MVAPPLNYKCPECRSLMVIFDFEKDETGTILSNKAECTACGWEGTVEELKF